MEFIIHAKGHENIRGLHKTTLEITKETHLTPRGDCIIGVSADKSMQDFPEEFKEKIRKSKKIIVEIEVGGLRDVVVGEGMKN